jgi:hypothetical protein
VWFQWTQHCTALDPPFLTHALRGRLVQGAGRFLRWFAGKTTAEVQTSTAPPRSDDQSCRIDAATR